MSERGRKVTENQAMKGEGKTGDAAGSAEGGQSPPPTEGPGCKWEVARKLVILEEETECSEES